MMNMIKKHRAYQCLVFALCLLPLLGGCPSDDPNSDGDDGAIERPDTTKLNLNGQRVTHTMWGEPGDDPRQLIGYQLDNDAGTPFFDNYVLLYGFRLMMAHDCAAISKTDGRLCQKSGLHIHLEDQIQQYYLDEYEKYIKPVRDRGIKVIMSIVPRDSGVCLATLYEGPKDWKDKDGKVYADWKDYYGYDYPASPDDVKRMIDDICDIYQGHPFDGIGVDDEYGILKGAEGPMGDPYTYSKGANILRFCWELEQAIVKRFGVKPEDWITEVYEYRDGRNLPAIFLDADGGTHDREDIIDLYAEATYGSWQVSSANVGAPRSKFCPSSIAISQTAFPQPPQGRSGPGILQLMENHLKGNYGVVMYYCFGSDLVGGEGRNRFGPGSPGVEGYLSQISRTLHGYETVYIGQHYPQAFSKTF